VKLTESEIKKNMKAKIEKAAFIKCLNLNSLVTKLLKQLWASLFSQWAPLCRENVSFYLTQHWLDLANHCFESTRLDQVMDPLLTRNILGDSDSKGLRLNSTRDSTNMSRPHHWDFQRSWKKLNVFVACVGREAGHCQSWCQARSYCKTTPHPGSCLEVRAAILFPCVAME